jgi:hypothetical protein
MFRFITHNLSPLKHVPFLALWFDAMAMIWTAWFSPEVACTIEKIEHEVSAWKGVTTSLHKFGGLQFNYAGKELGHIHRHGILDIPFSRALKESLLQEGRAEEHHVFKQSGWISFYIRSSADADNALSLLTLAYRRATGAASNLEPPATVSACGQA